MVEKTKFLYLRVGSHYYCAEQSLATAIRVFFVAHNRLHLQSLGLRRKHAGRVVLALIAWRLRLRTFTVITLPVFGHMCVAVHRGHKVFDLARGSVTKVFLPNTNRRLVACEIAGALTQAQLGFAPTILGRSVERGWYAETYFRGDRGHTYYGADLDAFWDRFDRDIVRCLERIVLLHTPRSTTLDRYALKAVDRIKRRVSQSSVRQDTARVILRFIDYVHEDIQSARGSKIWLSFSHGDFYAANILRTEHAMAVVDWESATQRSILFDLYSYLFGEMYHGRVQLSATQMSRAIRSMDTRLHGQTAEALQIGAMASVYRHLFYLERLRLIAKRYMASDQFARVMLRTVEIFSTYEVGFGERTTSTAADVRYDSVLANVRQAERSRKRQRQLRYSDRPRWPARAASVSRHGAQMMNFSGGERWAYVVSTFPW